MKRDLDFAERTWYGRHRDVAQKVARRAHAPEVGGSIPSVATIDLRAKAIAAWNHIGEAPVFTKFMNGRGGRGFVMFGGPIFWIFVFLVWFSVYLLVFGVELIFVTGRILVAVILSLAYLLSIGMDHLKARGILH